MSSSTRSTSAYIALASAARGGPAHLQVGPLQRRHEGGDHPVVVLHEKNPHPSLSAPERPHRANIKPL